MGRWLVRLARKTVEDFMAMGEVLEPSDVPKEARKEMGAFTTIKTFPSGNLRGCMGIPYPVMPLYKAVQQSALMAAFEDPRFVPLSPEELKEVIFEVTVLTPPRFLRKGGPDAWKDIVVGKHGIIIRQGSRSGLLLPQVPVEEGWDSRTFLSYGCLKAGLPPDCWLDEKTEIYVFEGIVFTEKEPEGEIIQQEL